MRRLIVVCLVVLVSGALAAPSVLAGSGYPDTAYVEHDLDNVSRSTGRWLADLTRPEWHEAMRSATAQAYLASLGIQLSDIGNGRLHTGLGQWIPGGSVGDPETYNGIPSRRVQFLARTGAKLSGHI